MMKLTTCALSLMAIGAEAATESRNLRAVPSVNLGVAGEFAILSTTGVTDVYPSVVVGDVGSSPITGAAILLACDEVIGNVYSVDAAGPACKTTAASRLTTAIGDMTYAYNSAAGVSNPDFFNLQAGSIGGETLAPGVYKWASNVAINADIMIEGTYSSFDKWIFQVDGTMDMAAGMKMILSNGAKPKNIVWQVGAAVTLGAGAHLEGTVLGKTAISLLTGASANGRLLAGTAVALQVAVVVQPQL